MSIFGRKQQPWIKNRPQAWAEERVPPPNTVCISICHSSDVQLPKGYADVLRLRFDDTDRDGQVLPHCHPATDDDVARIAVFLLKHRGKNIVVHCTAGISRSGAIIEAALLHMREYQDRGWPRDPNRRLRYRLSQALSILKGGER